MNLLDTWKNRYKELLTVKVPQTLAGLASNPQLNQVANRLSQYTPQVQKISKFMQTPIQARVGQVLQKVPEMKPFGEYTSTLAPGLTFGPQLIQGYGRTIERAWKPQVAAKQYKAHPFQTGLEDIGNIADIAPIGVLGAAIVKKAFDAKKLAKIAPDIDHALKLVRNYDILQPNTQMFALRKIDEVMGMIDKGYLLKNNKFLRVLADTQPEEYRNLAGRLFEDSQYAMKHPQLALGASIKELKKPTQGGLTKNQLEEYGGLMGHLIGDEKLDPNKLGPLSKTVQLYKQGMGVSDLDLMEAFNKAKLKGPKNIVSQPPLSAQPPLYDQATNLKRNIYKLMKEKKYSEMNMLVDKYNAISDKIGLGTRLNKFDENGNILEQTAKEIKKAKLQQIEGLKEQVSRLSKEYEKPFFKRQEQERINNWYARHPEKKVTDSKLWMNPKTKKIELVSNEFYQKSLSQGNLGEGVKGINQQTKQGIQKLEVQSKKLTQPKVSPITVRKPNIVGGNEVYVPAKPLKTPSEIEVPSASSIAQTKYAENINLERLNLKPQEKQVLRTTIDSIKPELEKIKGKTLSHKEVLEAAKKSDILTKITTRDETLAAEAATLKARQRLVELDKNVTELANSGNIKQLKKEMTDLVDSLKVVHGDAADAGRKLESFKIGAEDESLRMSILKEVGKTEAETSKIVEEAAKVNWNDANSITAFYRKFIKPTAMEVLDEYRYNNMLSNPRTHIRNAFSNLIQTFITRPGTLAAQGKPIEATKYYSGALKSFPQAVDSFLEHLKGKAPITKPDIAYIGTKKLPKFMTIPTRAMEAGDKFFSALIEGGELARGATPAEAAKTAEYSLFRQGLFPEGQGKLLNFIDSVTAWTYKAPKPVRWFVPFIRTPMNFAKQWVEYSPVGEATMIGSTMKREQLGKAILGSLITTIGAKFALEGNTTWDAPTDPKQKELFYASGRKPYSVKVGNKWVSMMYAGPFAVAFALPAAVKYQQDESRTALTDSQLTKLTNSVMSMAKFLSGQTFLEGINNFVRFFSGDIDYSLPSNLAFTAGQVIPMEGLVRWISTIVDPIYRKGTSFTEGLQKNLPFLSKNLPAYTNPMGEPSVREPINYLTPYDISTNQPQYEEMYQQRTTKLQSNALENQIKKQIEESHGEPQISGSKIYYWDEEAANVKTIDLSPIKQPNLTGNTELDKIKISSYNLKITAQIKDIAKLEELGQITANEAEAQIKKLTDLKITAPKKAKKLTLKKVTLPKIPAPIKIKKIKVKRPTKTVKSLRAKKAKITTKKINLKAKI